MEKKKENKSSTSKTTKKKIISTKKTTDITKKNKARKKKKKGFTLIELLAVIIILGILMIIAIPSVTRYINDSRKSAYVDTAKDVVAGTRNLVNAGDLEMYDTNTTYYIPASYIKTENALKSPYGEFKDNSAYVGVIYNGDGYRYYWISSDETGQGIDEVTPLEELDTDDIKSDLNPNDIYDTVKTTGIGKRSEIKILKSTGTWDDYSAENKISEDGGEIGSISFSEDSWSTIAKAVKDGNTDAYHVGDTKEVNLGDLGVHTVRIANMSTPDECSTSGFSQTACDFVIEFADVISNQRMNPNEHNSSVNGDGNKGGWQYSEMRQYVNTTVYNSLPNDLKSAIIDTFAVSSYGVNDNSNFETTDKLYLLSKVEVDGSVYNQYTDSKYSRQLDYYSGYQSNAGIAKKYRGNSYSIWCLRSAAKSPSYPGLFYGIRTSDGWVETYGACSGASPAFRIG